MYLGIHLKNLLLLIVVALALFACEQKENPKTIKPVSYTHLRAHETVLDLVCRLLLEKKNIKQISKPKQPH